MPDTHADEGSLRAYLDGELGWLDALRTRWHLRGCAACRRALEEERHLGERSGAMLSVLNGPIDVEVEAAWWRVAALSGTNRQHAPRSRRLVPLAAALVLIAALAVMRVEWGPGHSAGAPGAQRTRDVCCFDLDGGGPGDDGVFTLSRGAEVVECVLLYDDADGSRSYSRGDRVRAISGGRSCPQRLAQLLRPQDGALLALGTR